MESKFKVNLNNLVRSCLKIKMTEDLTHLVQCLPSMQKALDSIPALHRLGMAVSASNSQHLEAGGRKAGAIVSLSLRSDQSRDPISK